MEDEGQEREEALESLVGWPQKQESEEGEGRSYKVQKLVNKIHGRGSINNLSTVLMRERERVKMYLPLRREREKERGIYKYK